MDEDLLLEFSFEATVIHWRGPAPYFYAPIPAPRADDVRWAAKVASYGWGCVPVEARIGDVAFTTSLFPKDGTYLVPIKAAVRRQVGVTAGDAVGATIVIRPPRR